MRKQHQTPAVTFAALGFLLPNLIGFALFTMMPILLSLAMGFTNWSLKPAVKLRFTGLENAVDILGLHAVTSAPAWPVVVYYGAALAAVVAGVALAWGFVSSWRRTAKLALSVMLAAAVMTLWLLNDTLWSYYAPNDRRFWHYLFNTLYLMLGIPPSIVGSLLLAMLLKDDLQLGRAGRRAIFAILCALSAIISVSVLWLGGWRNCAGIAGLFWLLAGLGLAFGKIAFRGIFYLPTFTSGIALMILWKAMYNPQTGILNNFLSQLTGLPVEQMPLWLSSVAMAKPSLIIMGVWLAIGGMNMLLYLAALTNVPPELIEAASIDGAGPWQRFRHIYIPQLAPTTFFISVMSVIGGLQGGFEQARVMTGGGPAGSTTTLAYYIYTMAFEDLQLGRAAAVSWILFLMLFAFTAIHWKLGNRQEH